MTIQQSKRIRKFSRPGKIPIGLIEIAIWVSCWSITSPAIAQEPEKADPQPWSVDSPIQLAEFDQLPSSVKRRVTIRTPKEDTLLYRLEQDYIRLLPLAARPSAILAAEKLLDETNDNSRWTNYSSATKILRQNRDKAAIPLLLRYMVLHAKRSACHVMIPEYEATISTISGHKLKGNYQSVPDLSKHMRARVAKIVNEWWGKHRDGIQTHPNEMSTAQLQVLVDQVLKRVLASGDYSGAGGKPDSAYLYYHIMVYHVMSKLKQQTFEARDLNNAMIPLILARSGYVPSSDGSQKQQFNKVHFEAIPVLASLRLNQQGKEIEDIAKDRSQNNSVRLTCILALFKAGEKLCTGDLIEILASEKSLSNRLITILALGYGGKTSVPVLLEQLKDANSEVCVAAACALRTEHPPQALPEFDRLIRSGVMRGNPSGLLYSALGEFKNQAGRETIATILEDILDGQLPASHLDSALSALMTVCEIDYWNFKGKHGKLSKETQARAALQWYANSKLIDLQLKQALLVQLDNAVKQLEVAVQIEQIRKTEYKRLVLLQVDEVMKPEDSEEAYRLLQETRSEVKLRRNAVESARIKLGSSHEKPNAKLNAKFKPRATAKPSLD